MKIENEAEDGNNKKGDRKFTVNPSPVADCIQRAGGDLGAGILLYRVNWWHSHSHFQRDGMTWVVLTREEWMTDTGLTRHQYDRALSVLKDKGLVVVTHGKLRRTDKHTRAFIRPQLSAGTETSAPDQLSGLAETSTPELSAKTETCHDQLSATPDDKKGRSIQQENNISGVFPQKTEGKFSLGKFAGKKEQALMVWNSSMREKYKASPVPPKNWQAKRLGDVLDYLGEHLPTADPLDVVRSIVTRWDDFRDHQRSKAGPILREQPDAGTVLNFIPDVVDWFTPHAPAAADPHKAAHKAAKNAKLFGKVQAMKAA